MAQPRNAQHTNRASPTIYNVWLEPQLDTPILAIPSRASRPKGQHTHTHTPNLALLSLAPQRCSVWTKAAPNEESHKNYIAPTSVAAGYAHNADEDKLATRMHMQCLYTCVCDVRMHTAQPQAKSQCANQKRLHDPCLARQAASPKPLTKSKRMASPAKRRRHAKANRTSKEPRLPEPLAPTMPKDVRPKLCKEVDLPPAAFATAGGAPTHACTYAHGGKITVRSFGWLAEAPPEGGAGPIARALVEPNWQ